MTKEIGGKSVNMNLLRLDLTKVRLDVHHAMDAAIGTEKTSSIATRHGAFAAINAGFFLLDKSEFAGESSGILKIDGNVLSESSDRRIAVSIINSKKRTKVEFGHTTTTTVVGFREDDTLVLDGINRERKPNDIVLFTSDFDKSTKTDGSGTEIILDPCNQLFRWWCRKLQANHNLGNSQIPPNGLVISIGKEALERAGNFLIRVEKGPGSHRALASLYRVVRRVELLEPRKQEFFLEAEDITNGVPQLIKRGTIDITWEQEKATKSFVETRHPRTAVATLKDGKFLMITVDGRSEVSGGIGLQDLAEYLLSLGATDAMNLDGGGSTTMFVDGKVVNKPSDKEGERKVSDSILVTLRKK